MAPEIDVRRKDLLVQAGIWVDQGGVLDHIAKATNNLYVAKAGGAFEKAIALYNLRTQEIGYWSWEGASVMLKIARALTEAAKRYEATEREISIATRGAINE